MRWTQQRRRGAVSQGESLVSDQPVRRTNGAKARRSLLAKTGCCVRQNRVVLAPVAGVKSAEVLVSPTGRDKAFNSPMTVTRRIRRRGERGISRKAHCAGNAGLPPLNLYARVRIFLCNLHTRPRVQRASGISCSLFE